MAAHLAIYRLNPIRPLAGIVGTNTSPGFFSTFGAHTLQGWQAAGFALAFPVALQRGVLLLFILNPYCENITVIAGDFSPFIRQCPSLLHYNTTILNVT